MRSSLIRQGILSGGGNSLIRKFPIISDGLRGMSFIKKAVSFIQKR
jgi:hypothetical protein